MPLGGGRSILLSYGCLYFKALAVFRPPAVPSMYDTLFYCCCQCSEPQGPVAGARLFDRIPGSYHREGIRVIDVKKVTIIFVSEREKRMIRINRLVALALAVIMIAGCSVSFAESEEWVCPGCGASNSTNFCTKCGTQKPEEIVCPECGTKYPMDSDAIYCGNCGVKLLANRNRPVHLEGDGFDTPEEAVAFYLEGIKKLDYNQILGAFAWETQAAHFSIETKIKRLQSYQLSMKPRMPAENDFMRSALLYSLLSYQTDSIYNAIELFCLQENHPNTASLYNVSLKDDAEYDVFMSSFSNDRIQQLAKMDNIRFLTPDEVTDNMFSNERNQENYLKFNAMYDADETVDVPATADIGDGFIFCCPTVARYGDKWYLVSVHSFTSMIIGLSVTQQAFVTGEGSIKDFLNK